MKKLFLILSIVSPAIHAMDEQEVKLRMRKTSSTLSSQAQDQRVKHKAEEDPTCTQCVRDSAWGAVIGVCIGYGAVAGLQYQGITCPYTHNN